MVRFLPPVSTRRWGAPCDVLRFLGLRLLMGGAVASISARAQTCADGRSLPPPISTRRWGALCDVLGSPGPRALMGKAVAPISTRAQASADGAFWLPPSARVAGARLVTCSASLGLTC